MIPLFMTPQTLFEVALSAVQSAMPHLSKAEILDPPHGWFDAQFARQIAVHVTVRGLNVPQRRVAQINERRRGSICHAVRVVDTRITVSPAFCTTYLGISTAAKALVAKRSGKVAPFADRRVSNERRGGTGSSRLSCSVTPNEVYYG